MNKKIANGLLIFGVLIIWIFVLKRTTHIFKNENSNVLTYSSIENEPEIDIKFKKDTFNIGVYKRDPFLDGYGKTFKRKMNNSKNTPKKVNKKPISKKNIGSKMLWPKLKYYGYMKGGSNKEKLALIKMNNKLHRVRSQQEINNILVYSVFADSVILKMNSQFKTVYK
ncbi:hypothetical protein [uncultured Maribacter sp.]|uniref:hypothetical protein n=1 Tax=uncultured Maribacter sp. TaxID=431308 RepID=UPI00260A3361|nr:hypothetical protein [uncultured Maribacter sp.]